MKQTRAFLRWEVFCGGENLPSAVREWPAADWFEREVYDLMGIDFDDHIDLKRLLLPSNFVDQPMRKDYPLTVTGEREEVDMPNALLPGPMVPFSAEGEPAVLDWNPLGQGLRLQLEFEGESWVFYIVWPSWWF